jgi:hypothetical protein
VALIPNERTKLAATYLNGLAIASAAIGGISQAVAAGSGGSVTAYPAMLGWIALSLGLHLAAQAFLGRLRE